MWRLLLPFLLAATLLLPQAGGSKPAFTKLTPEQLKEMVEGGKKFLFLDVRKPKEIENLGTIRGFVNIPLGQLESRLKEIPKNMPIVSACNFAGLAATAAEVLAKHGYSGISLVAMNEYKGKGYKLVYPKAGEKK